MKGLFLDLPSTPPGYLPELTRHLEVHDPGVNELALTGVYHWSWPELDTTMLPTYVYPGAPWAHWWGPRYDTPPDLATSPSTSWMLPVAGAAGMLTPSYRWEQINLDTEVLRASTQRGHHFYISQEVGIDAIGDHPRLRQAWEAYLIEVCRRATQMRGGIIILWSPYAWDPWSSVSAFRRTRIAAAMKTMIGNVKQATGIWKENFIIDLQDGQGVQPTEPASDAVNWYNLIKDCGATVRINAEWFLQDNNPQEAKVMKARLDYYKQQNTPVGVCWEAKDWLVPYFANHL